MQPELIELNRVRLEANLTYEELAKALEMSRRNVIRLLTEPRAGMQERTRFRIRQFLNQHRKPVA